MFFHPTAQDWCALVYRATICGFTVDLEMLQPYAYAFIAKIYSRSAGSMPVSLEPVPSLS